MSRFRIDYQLWVRECEADDNFCSRNAHSDQGDFASVVTISKADAEEEGVFSGFDGTDGYFVSQSEWGLETGKACALDVRAQDDAGAWGPWDHGTFNVLGACLLLTLRAVSWCPVDSKYRLFLLRLPFFRRECRL
jgi:hypothetical protein